MEGHSHHLPHPTIHGGPSRQWGFPLRHQSKRSKWGQRGSPSQPRAQAPPTGAVHLAQVWDIGVEIFAPLSAVDLEDAAVDTSIGFVVHGTCVEAACEVSKTDPCIGWRHRPAGGMTEANPDQRAHGVDRPVHQFLQASTHVSSRSGLTPSHLLDKGIHWSSEGQSDLLQLPHSRSPQVSRLPSCHVPSASSSARSRTQEMLVVDEWTRAHSLEPWLGRHRWDREKGLELEKKWVQGWLYLLGSQNFHQLENLVFLSFAPCALTSLVVSDSSGRDSIKGRKPFFPCGTQLTRGRGYKGTILLGHLSPTLPGSYAILTQRTWTWAKSRRWWGTGKPGMLQSFGVAELDTTWWFHNNNLSPACWVFTPILGVLHLSAHRILIWKTRTEAPKATVLEWGGGRGSRRETSGSLQSARL